MPQSKSACTIEIPAVLEERTRRTPCAPVSVLSIGKVTSRSISIAAKPGASVSTVTVGAVRSGNTSTGMRRAARDPHTNSAQALSNTTARWRRDQAMRASMA